MEKPTSNTRIQMDNESIFTRIQMGYMGRNMKLWACLNIGYRHVQAQK